MRKFLLFVMGAMLATTSFAQEEDATSLIANSGFDEDLTFQADGSMKKIVSTEKSLSDRSWAYVAEDSSVYAKPKSTSSQKRKDGVDKLLATNGFIGQVKGWTIETNQKFPACEWVYFGTIPYDLGEKAVPIADDGDTYLGVPAKPDAYSGDDNVGFAYLRAGWGGRAVYKQTVKLPCAKYRLEYWAININPSATNGSNLSQVTCRKDTWKDETGFNDTEWTLHTIEFTPTSEFSMQFGFESSGGSGSNPFLCIDGIKLYKIDEADTSELLASLANDCRDLAKEASGVMLSLSEYIDDYALNLESVSGEEAMVAAIEQADIDIEAFRQAINMAPTINALLAKMDAMLALDYAGKDALKAAYDQINGYTQGYEEGQDLPALLLGAVDEGIAAMKAYCVSQVANASAENPVDMTAFIQNPWFIDLAAEPVFDGDIWMFPNELNEDGTSNYSEGSATSPDLNGTGWYVAGITGGDQRLNWQRGRSCWNSWASGFTGSIAVGQDISELPNGYYTVTADLITQSGMMTDQHVFAQSIAEKKISTATLTQEGWDYSEWETVAMTADDKVLVVDGKLTIGAEGTGSGNGAAGWFCATNFHLYYLGAAPADAAQKAFDAKLADAEEMADRIPFAGDKKAFNDSIALYRGTTDYIEGMTGIAAAVAEANKSIAKWEEYVPADGTIDGKTLPTVMNTLKENGGDGYGKAEEIVKFAYDYVMNWVKVDSASYVDFDAQMNLLKNYLNTYVPVYNEAAETAASSTEAGKKVLETMMAEQKAALTAEMKDLETVNAYVAELQRVLSLIERQNIWETPDAKDYTAFIENPMVQAESGWSFTRGNGDKNSTSGQWFDGSDTRYIDSYNASGLEGFSAMQLIENLPNGTYTVGAYTRTPAEGAYILHYDFREGVDTVFVEIPVDTYQGEETMDTVAVASDKFGPIWEEAKKAVMSGDYTDAQYAIYNTNMVEGVPTGRGWKHQEMTDIVVTNHKLLIGTMAGTEASKTPKVFTGSWYSVGGWTLTLIELGDNEGWEGPIAANIRSIETDAAVDGIYTLTGAKVNSLKRGLNIVVSGGKARKIMVK